jgi:ubiquinone/menaquinone biosynthesis C-methylase UbiE
LNDQHLYGAFNGLESSLRTGQPQTTTHGENFAKAMNALSTIQGTLLSTTFDFSQAKTYCDIGGGVGTFNISVGERHPHLQGTIFDLPGLRDSAERNIQKSTARERIRFQGGDFFQDPLPKADVISMSNILHNWSEQQRRSLIKKAYEALSPGGSLLVVEGLLDDDQPTYAVPYTVSLTMLVDYGGGAANFHGRDLRRWTSEAGFSDLVIQPLAPPMKLAVARKSHVT